MGKHARCQRVARQCGVLMRTVRVLLRIKSSRSDTRRSAKVVTNCRVPGRSKPVQIHLGYLSLIFEGGIPSGRRDKLLKNLRSKWQLLFSNSDVDVDWADAEAKLRQLRARQSAPLRTAPPGGAASNPHPSGQVMHDERKAKRSHRRTHDRRQVILFLAANHDLGTSLRLSEECAEIHRELKMSLNRDAFRFESRWAVSIDELMRHLMELDPTVVHFSGHGSGSEGLILRDEEGRPQPILGPGLAMMLEAAGRNVRVLVLNACYSAAQARVLSSKIDCVVGMDGAIGDRAARAFAIRFYGALGNGRSIGNAVAHGVAALAARQLPDEVLPRCLTRPGIDPHELVLTGAGT